MLNSIPTFPILDRPKYSLSCAPFIRLLNVTVVEFHIDSEPDELSNLLLFSFNDIENQSFSEGIFSNMWKEVYYYLCKKILPNFSTIPEKYLKIIFRVHVDIFLLRSRVGFNPHLRLSEFTKRSCLIPVHQLYGFPSSRLARLIYDSIRPCRVSDIILHSSYQLIKINFWTIFYNFYIQYILVWLYFNLVMNFKNNSWWIFRNLICFNAQRSARTFLQLLRMGNIFRGGLVLFRYTSI